MTTLLSDTEFTQELIPGSIKKAMAGSSSTDLWQPDISKLRLLPGFNSRVKDDSYTAHIRYLADSMKANGFLRHKPIEVFVAKEDGVEVIYITDGHCRYDAVLLANSELPEDRQITRVPAVTPAGGTNMVDMTIGLIISNDGKPLSTYEKACVFKRLSLTHGLTISEISVRVGVTASYVDRLLYMMSLPSKVHTYVQSGVISVDLAVEMAKEHGDKIVEKLDEAVSNVKVQKAESNDADAVVRVTKKHVTSPKTKFDKAVSKSAPQFYSAINRLQAHPSFASLPEDIRSEIQTLLDTLPKIEPDSVPDAKTEAQLALSIAEQAE